MKSHALRNSKAVLVEEARGLLVDAGRRYPVDIGVLSLTSRCSLDCVMCLEPADAPRGLDLPPEDAARLAELFAGRVAKVWSCAGEALLYPGFFDLARRISARGTPLGVGTNGLALAKPGVVRRCAEAGVRWLHISCHTCRPRRFAALTGRAAPALFETFARALDAVDAWNRDHAAAERLEVILQLVPMKGFVDEIDDYFAFIRRRLAHSPLTVRVEPMQALGKARGRPELALDVGQLAGVVAEIVCRRPPDVKLEFKSMPLCLLAGREGLSEDLRCIAGSVLRVGNMDCRSTDLQLVCPVGDPKRSAAGGACGRCALEPLCPGLADIPVPARSSWPRPSRVRPEAVLESAGLAPGYMRREEAPVYPAAADVPEGPRPLTAERLGVDPAAGRRFSAEQRRLLEALPAVLGGKVAEAKVAASFAAVRLESPEAVVVFEPAADDVPHFFTAAGVAVRYNGELTGELSACLEAARRHLRGEGR